MPWSRRGRNTLANAVAHGISVGSWNTKPIGWELRPGARAPLLQTISPRVGSASAAIRRNAVDLPQPEGPSKDTNSRSRIDKSKSASATTEFGNVFPTPRSVRIGGDTGAYGCLLTGLD